MKTLSCISALLVWSLSVSAVTIRIDPSTTSTSIGSAIDVNVQNADVADLYPYQLDLTFNPTILSASTMSGNSTPGYIPADVENGTVSVSATVAAEPATGLLVASIVVFVIRRTGRSALRSWLRAGLLALRPKTIKARLLLAGFAVAMLPTLIVAQSLDCAKLVPIQLPFLSDAAGWAKPEYYTTITTAYVTGRANRDLVARGPNGIMVWTWDSVLGSWIPGPSGPPLSDAAGWNRPENYLTIRYGDIDHDNQDELIARNVDGVHTWKYNPNSRTWAELGAVLPINSTDCVDASCYTTFRVGDIDGDGNADLIYRDRNALWAYSWKGSQWVLLGSIVALSDQPSGWNLEPYYTSINLADIDGKGGREVVARYVDGLHVWNWTGSAFAELIPKLADVSDDRGWKLPQYHLTMQYSRGVYDTLREGLVARDGDGLHVWSWNGDEWGRFDFTRFAGDFTRNDAYWNEPQFYRSIQLAHLAPGDGRPQVIALTPTGLGIWAYDPSSLQGQWKRVSTYTPISPGTGWALPQSYLTLQSPAAVRGQPLVLGRSPSSLVTLAYDPQSGLLGSAGKPGFPTVSVAAYQSVSQQLPPSDPKDNIRAHYTDLALKDSWGGYQATVKGLKGATPPQGVSPADFEATRQQIENELGMVPTVINWFTLSRGFIDEVYGDYPSLVTEVQLGITLDSNSSANVAFNWISAILKILSSIATISGQPQLSGVMSLESTVFSIAAAGPSGQGGLNPAVYQILQNLDQQRTNARDANSCATNAFLQNWALMSPLSQGVLDNSLNWNSVDQTAAEDAAENGYKYWLYQTLTPAAWSVLESCSRMYGCVISAGYPDEYIFDNGRASLYLSGGFRYVSPLVSTLDKLFKVPPAGYGTPLRDVFYGLNGWNLPGTLTTDSALNQARLRDVRQSVRGLMNEVRRNTIDESVRGSLLEPLEMVLEMLRESRPGGTMPRHTALNMLQLFQLRLQLHSGSKLTATSALAHAESAYGIAYLLTDYPAVEIQGTSHHTIQ